MVVRNLNADARDVSGGGSQSAPSPKESQPAAPQQSHSALRTAALLCAVAVIWLATRRYLGTMFDARFYMVGGGEAFVTD